MRSGVRGFLVIAMCLAWGLYGKPAAGQAAPLVLEVAGGASIPLGAFRSGTGPGEGTGTGPNFDLDFALSGSGRRTIVIGFSQHRFGCSAAGCPRGRDYVATGIDAGLRLNLVTTGSVHPWLGAGAITRRVEIPPLNGAQAGVSRLGVGGDLAFGVYVGASRAIALNPRVRFMAVNTGLPDRMGTLRMRYVVADLAVALSF